MKAEYRRDPTSNDPTKTNHNLDRVSNRPWARVQGLQRGGHVCQIMDTVSYALHARGMVTRVNISREQKRHLEDTEESTLENEIPTGLTYGVGLLRVRHGQGVREGQMKCSKDLWEAAACTDAE